MAKISKKDARINEEGKLICMTIRPAWILAILIVAGYVIGLLGRTIVVCPAAFGGLDCEPAVGLLAQYNLLVVNYHQYYQMFSSVFVTDSFEDAGFNALAVIILDRFMDTSSFNKTRFFSIFVLSALLGNVLTLLAGPYYASAGASGGIFGLYAAAFSFSWAQDKKIDRVSLGLFLAIFVTSSFLLQNVNWLAHLGGAIGGFIFGPLLYFSMREKLESYALSTSDSLLVTKLITAFLVLFLTIGTIVQFLFFVMQ